MACEISIGEAMFPSKEAAKAAVQSILNRYSIGSHLSTEDQIFVHSLLLRHPRADLKIDTGVKSISVWSPPPWRRNKGFLVHRIDGTSTDFSYLECLSPSSHWIKVQRAFRAVIADQVTEFKRRSFGGRDLMACEITGEMLTADTCHIDHDPEFLVLIDNFLRVESMDISRIVLTREYDHKTVEEFHDKAIGQRFADFHRQYARLRVISRRANLSRPRPHLLRDNRPGKGHVSVT
jgi:hypothetical protein